MAQMVKNKALLLLLSLVISFGLWLYVVTVISPESEQTYYNVPVELVGADWLDSRGLLLVSDTKNLKMELTLVGKRSDLNKLNSGNITIISDLSTITQAGEYQLPCKISFESGTADVLEQNPEYISVVVAEQTTKTVPVKVTYTGSVANGYQADKDNSSMDHATVTVKGPKDVVERLSHAAIAVDLSGKMNDIVGDYPLTLYGLDGKVLVDDQYVTTNVTEIRIAVPVNRIKIVKLAYDIDYTASGLTSEMVTWYASAEEVTLIGSEEALAKTREQYDFTVSLRDYDSSEVIHLSLSLPEGVTCKEEISLYLNIPQMDSVYMDVSDFVLVNVPDGLDISLSEQTQQVQLRGPKEILDKLSADMIRAEVNCAEVTAASGYAPVTYYVREYGYVYVYCEWSNVVITVTETQNGES